jgi:hypothetical protein
VTLASCPQSETSRSKHQPVPLQTCWMKSRNGSPIPRRPHIIPDSGIASLNLPIIAGILLEIQVRTLYLAGIAATNR